MKKIERAASKFLRERGWDQLRPGDLAKSISIEAGELLEHFQWTNPELQQVKGDKEKVKEVAKELADVLLYALYLSISLGLDTEKIMKEKLSYAAKKYPSKLVKKQKGKDPGTEELYHSIKKTYRRSGLS